MILLTTLLLKAFDNRELSRVMNVLHDDPIDGLFVLFVDSRGFDEFEFDFFDALRVVFAVEVADECVDHFGRLIGRVRGSTR